MTTEPSGISVAMATYNGSRFLGEQLESLGRQQRLPRELVVVDDGSRDDTLQVVRSFAQGAPFPVRIYSNGENLGYGETFLKAASLCEGEWIAFCDQDDVWLPEKIRTLEQALGEDPSLNVIIHNALVCNEDLKPLGFWRGMRLYHFHGRDHLSAGQLSPYRVFIGCCISVKRSFLEDFPVSIRAASAQERSLLSHDLWVMVLASAFGGVRLMPEPLLLYRRHEQSATLNRRYRLRHRLASIREPLEPWHHDAAIMYANFAEYLRKVAAHRPGSQSTGYFPDSIKDAVRRFELHSNEERQRTLLYGKASRWRRLEIFIQLWRSGYYSGSAGMGWRMQSAVKDFLRVCLGGRGG